MAYINVDHSRFDSAANAIKDHVTNAKRSMSDVGISLAALAVGWEGKDYAEFQKRAEQLTSEDSTFRKYVDSLDNYADFLKYAADRYKKAQTDAYNKANSLPKY